MLTRHGKQIFADGRHVADAVDEAAAVMLVGLRPIVAISLPGDIDPRPVHHITSKSSCEIILDDQRKVKVYRANADGEPCFVLRMMNMGVETVVGLNEDAMDAVANCYISLLVDEMAGEVVR